MSDEKQPHESFTTIGEVAVMPENDLNLGATGNPWNMTDKQWAALCEVFELDRAEGLLLAAEEREKSTT